MESDFQIVADKDIRAGEFALLMEAVGYGRAGHYAADVIERSLAAYPFVAHARDARSGLVGYVSAFSDGAFSTFTASWSCIRTRNAEESAHDCSKRSKHALRACRCLSTPS